MGHTFSRVLLHVVFSTKGRKNTLYRAMREDLLTYIRGIAVNEGADVSAANAVADHVHLLLVVKPAQAPSDLMRKIKANSSRWIRQTYGDLRGFSWQSGYGMFSVSESAKSCWLLLLVLPRRNSGGFKKSSALASK